MLETRRYDKRKGLVFSLFFCLVLVMLMFHGAFKPAGFNRTFPHAVAREAVLGSEYNMWSNKVTPEHNLLLPFIRMVSGPMDYEPGMLSNSSPKTFRTGSENVMSLTTRCQQLAMFVIYESPIQFFAGNPSQGLMEPAFMELLGPSRLPGTRLVYWKQNWATTSLRHERKTRTGTWEL